MTNDHHFDMLYVHSPITYSIARHIVDNGLLTHTPLIVCGRNTSWDGPHAVVENDGVWHIETTCAFLERVVEQIGDVADFSLDIYMPHTAFLLGKLLRLSGAVKGIYYIEEGAVAYNPGSIVDAWSNLPVDPTALVDALESRGLLDKFKWKKDDLLAINALEFCCYDDKHPNYRGAFGVSDAAFPGSANVVVLSLSQEKIIPDDEQIWVCLLPCLLQMRSKHVNNTALFEKLLYGIVMMLRTQSALVNNLGGHLVIKFHPVDDANMTTALREEICRYGTGYTEFFEMNDFAIGHEAALYNFTRFVVIDGSSANRYINLFNQPGQLINITLD